MKANEAPHIGNLSVPKYTTLVIFSYKDCSPCKRLKKEILPKLMKKQSSLYIRIVEYEEIQHIPEKINSLLEQLKIESYPSFLLFDEIGLLRFSGFGLGKAYTLLEKAISNSEKKRVNEKHSVIFIKKETNEEIVTKPKNPKKTKSNANVKTIALISIAIVGSAIITTISISALLFSQQNHQEILIGNRKKDRLKIWK
jgi:thioredoxin-related protein